MPRDEQRRALGTEERGIPPVLVIGVDPGRETGWVVYDVLHGEITEAVTISFWEALFEAALMNPEQVLFIVEDPARNRPVFDHNARGAAREKIAQNVGGNKREASLFIEGLRLYGFCVVEVRPSEKKWSSNLFRSITGYDRRVSQHVRDAARLCFGVQRWPQITQKNNEEDHG